MQIPSKYSDSVKNSNVQWGELIAELFDRLTGKGASVNYTFENLIIDIPRTIGPRTEHGERPKDDQWANSHNS